MNFSVLMSVYVKENPFFLNESLNSILVDQTVIPNEVVLIKDGPLTEELDKVISNFQVNHQQLKVIALEKNVGLGEALSVGLESCSYDLVARMDSDDISESNRFEKQINYFFNHPKCVLLGSNIKEFHETVSNFRLKKQPLTKEEIEKYSKFRNPFNHPSVMFKKKYIVNLEGYEHCPLFEDYLLWVKVIHSGAEVANLEESTVYMRASNGLYSRRGGYKYCLNILNFRNKCLKNGYINIFDYIKVVPIQLIMALMPGSIREKIYVKVLRSEK